MIWSQQQWTSYRVWANTRCTGRLPLPLFGFDCYPRELAVCPLCDGAKADLEHVVACCKGTRFIREQYYIPRMPWQSFRSWLFTGLELTDAEGAPAMRILFLADCISALAESLSLSSQDISAMLDAAFDHTG